MMKRNADKSIRLAVAVTASGALLLAAAIAVNAVGSDDFGLKTRHKGARVSLVDRETFEMAYEPGDTLSLTNDNGRIAVQGWDRDYISMHVEKRLDVLDGPTRWSKNGEGFSPNDDSELIDIFEDSAIDMKTTPGRIDLHTMRHAIEAEASIMYHFDLKVPRNAALNLRTRNGLVAVIGIDGDVTAQSDNGPVACEDISGRVDVRAENGEVTCRDIDGPLVIRSTSGGIRVDDRDVTTAHAMVCETGNGSIKIHLHEGAAFDLNAATSNGRVVTELLAETSGSRTVTGQVRNGGPAMKFNTGNGSIYIDAS